MTSTAPRGWTDAMTLRAMSLIDNDGLSYEQVAAIMARETGVPMTRSTISGLVSRIRHADAAVPLGLLGGGAARRGGGQAGRRIGAVYLCLVKLLALPALAWWLATAFGLGGVAFATAVVFGAVPTASAAKRPWATCQARRSASSSAWTTRPWAFSRVTCPSGRVGS